MRRIKVFIIAIVLCGILNGEQALQEDCQTYALIICGINKDPEQQNTKKQSKELLQNYLIKHAGIPTEKVKVLDAFEGSSTQSTGINIRTAMLELSKVITVQDRFILYYIGQANAADGKLRLNLPGKDMTGVELAGLVDKINATSSLIVLDCPCSGMAIKPLSKAGRIVVASCRSDQPYSTHMSVYLLPALADPQADTDGNGIVSLLEAFTITAKKLDSYYQQLNVLKTEIMLLEDDGDGTPSQHPWRYKLDKNDGSEAAKYYFERSKPELK
ncbi:MAG: hypothetical protein KAS23_12330 [Anaerohalosphaera sp.]|nr:hypothetical protein [Anaerohalosphaera sp.]